MLPAAWAAGSSNFATGVLTQLCETSNSSSDDDSMSVLFPLLQASTFVSKAMNEALTGRR